MDDERLQQFSATVAAIHAAALQPEGWPHAMAQIARLQRAPRALLLTPEMPLEGGGFLVSHEVPAAFLAEWSTHYLAHDVWTAQGHALGVMRDGNVVLGTELMPDAELVRTVFYREFLSRQGIRKLCTGIVFAGQRAGLPLATCSAYRTDACEDFTEADRTVHRLLTAHLSIALGAMLRLRDREFRMASSLQALDQLPGAVLLMGRRGNVLFANRAARALLSNGPALSLRMGNPAQDAVGWLQAGQDDMQARLNAELRGAIANDPMQPAHFSQGLVIRRATGQGDLVLRVTPVAAQEPGWGAELHPSAIVFITDPQCVATLDAALLRRLYAITGAECRIAQALLSGLSLHEIAQHLHLSENTVKTHMKRLFEKTRTHRQQQLIRLLLSLARTD